MRKPIDNIYIVEEKENNLSATRINPIPLNLSGEIKEEWLQNLLHENPDILPVQMVDARIDTPLFSIGREVSTAAGPIDNLFVSQNGYPVVVETKLWRNPEARRKVVAQILDYSAQLKDWNYEKLEEEWKKRSNSSESLFSAFNPDFDEAQWIDNLNENLNTGRMALIIVGDGIRSEAECLVDQLSNASNLDFRLGLVELKLYNLSDSQTLVIPIVSMKTTEVGRFVVTVNSEFGDVSKVHVEAPAIRKKRTPSIFDEEAFLRLLKEYCPDYECKAKIFLKLLECLNDSTLVLEWGTTTLKIRGLLPDDSGKTFSLGEVRKVGLIFSCLRYPQRQLDKIEISKQVIDEVIKLHQAIGEKYSGHFANKGMEYSIDLKTLKDREQEYIRDLESILQFIDENMM